ncbi:MAG: NAD-dependent deacylase [Burkholderiales bacterium]|nr:NAD-dependent deacylase [Burkholderiales bacterium]
MSAESGIPTFRDALTGLWARFDPRALASDEGFRADPQRVWDWYAERREGVRRARPHAGHLALAGLAQRHPARVVVVTQNVDDLHQRAGSVDAIRLHGDLLDERWLDPCPRAARGGNVCDPEWAAPGRPPRCAECGNPLRPGVVWFGEMLPAGARRAADQAALRCAAMLVVGTSGAVWPAASLAATARRAGAAVIIVNPEPSEIDAEARLLVRATAALALPALLADL